jgi:hypothetical protein
MPRVKPTAIDNSNASNHTLIIVLTERELDTLTKLAARRKRTPIECVRDWIAAVQVDDCNAWRHPMSPVVKR